MQESTFTNYDQLPLFLNANTVAQVLGVSISSAYELMHEAGFPALRIGSRIVVPGEVHIENDVREVSHQLPTGSSGEGIAVQHAHDLIEQRVIILLVRHGK